MRQRIGLDVLGIEAGLLGYQACSPVTIQPEGKKVKVSLEQATKAQRGSRCIALLFL